jgi:hypothetical protein
MVGCNLDLIPMVNEFQIRFGLLGGEVRAASSSSNSRLTFLRYGSPASARMMSPLSLSGSDPAAKPWTRNRTFVAKPCEC